VADPQAEILRLCCALDIPVSPALDAIISAERPRQRKRKSQHSYT